MKKNWIINNKRILFPIIGAVCIELAVKLTIANTNDFDITPRHWAQFVFYPLIFISLGFAFSAIFKPSVFTTISKKTRMLILMLIVIILSFIFGLFITCYIDIFYGHFIYTRDVIYFVIGQIIESLSSD